MLYGQTIKFRQIPKVIPKYSSNTYHFQGPINFYHLCEEARQSGTFAFLAISDDKLYFGFSRQLPDTLVQKYKKDFLATRIHDTYLPFHIFTCKKNYTTLREALSEIEEVTFRTVPEGGEESYAFLNFFLPNLDTARKVIASFKEKGVDACFHYYDNNWHYVRKWDHLKDIKTLYPVSKEVKEGLSYLKHKTFDQSDHFIGRNISCLIKLSWTEAEVKERAKLMVQAIKESL